METGIKFDKEKPQMNLLDFSALEGLSQVLTMGAKKYGAGNWELGIDNSRLVASLLRHLSAHQRGEDIDDESGLPHIDHVGANWMFLSANLKLRPHLDTRTSRANAPPSTPTPGRCVQVSEAFLHEPWSHLIESLAAQSALNQVHG